MSAARAADYRLGRYSEGVNNHFLATVQILFEF